MSKPTSCINAAKIGGTTMLRRLSRLKGRAQKTVCRLFQPGKSNAVRFDYSNSAFPPHLADEGSCDVEISGVLSAKAEKAKQFASSTFESRNIISGKIEPFAFPSFVANPPVPIRFNSCWIICFDTRANSEWFDSRRVQRCSAVNLRVRGLTGR